MENLTYFTVGSVVFGCVPLPWHICCRLICTIANIWQLSYISVLQQCRFQLCLCLSLRSKTQQSVTHTQAVSFLLFMCWCYFWLRLRILIWYTSTVCGSAFWLLIYALKAESQKSVSGFHGFVLFVPIRFIVSLTWFDKFGAITDH